MTGRSTPRKVMGLCFPTEEERIVVALGRCRDHAIDAAATAVALTTSRQGRTSLRSALEETVRTYRTELSSALTPDVETRFAACAAEMSAARRYGETLAEMVAAPDRVDREAAVLLLEDARGTVLPALRKLTDSVLTEAAKDQNAVLDAIQSRNERLEEMLREMEEISHTIHVIGLNSAVEASRAGGASGRVFRIIATDVRSLAAKASSILARARRNLSSES